MNYIDKFILVAAFVLATNSATAADRGVYFGGSIGWSDVNGAADADLTVSVGPGLPSEISIDGFPLDDNDVAWSAFVGYQAFRYVGFELAYWDLGRFDSPILLPLSGDPPSLAIEEWSISARFRYPLGKKFFANWYAGISRAKFDAEGNITIFTFLPGPPPATGLFPIPFASPDDETGFIWGFGFTWQFLEKLGVGLDYRQHNVQVQDIDTVNLTLFFSL